MHSVELVNFVQGRERKGGLVSPELKETEAGNGELTVDRGDVFMVLFPVLVFLSLDLELSF